MTLEGGKELTMVDIVAADVAVARGYENFTVISTIEFYTSGFHASTRKEGVTVLRYLEGVQETRGVRDGNHIPSGTHGSAA